MSRSITRRTIFVIFLAITPALCAAQDKDICARQMQSEVARIERDMGRQRPAAGDREAQVQWSKSMHAALEQAGRRADQCRRDTGPKPSAAERELAQDCSARVRRDAEALQQRYGSRSMSAAEQATRRAEEMRLNDQMMACNAARRR